MNVSEKRLRANRENARKSTGPRTPEGKLASRANAITHGLCATVVVPEDNVAIQERAEAIYKAFKPYTDYQAWNVDRAAVLTLRVERVERMERRVRDKISLRAELAWDDDRALEAEVEGAGISRRPAEAVRLLKRTPHGCEWLISRWALLAHAAESQDGKWTPEQAALAFDLLGTPAPFREGRRPGVLLDALGHVIDRGDDPAAVARREIAQLQEHLPTVGDLDEAERVLTMADLDHESTSELRRLRRYEATLHNRLRWTVKQLTFQGPDGKPDPFFHPKWTVEEPPAATGPGPKTADEKAIDAHDPTSPSPPFDLEPDEFPAPREKYDLEILRESRRRKHREKRRTRRERDREKACKLRG